MKPFACVFPGQGSQSVGMLDAWGGHPVVRQTLDEASTALGEDLAALIHTGPKEELGLTSACQNQAEPLEAHVTASSTRLDLV
jgi:[acyl-carrier-protein] S-malonyltransferase